MCLYLKSNKVKIAKEDIICYKFLIKEAGSYFTPYQYTPIEIGKLLEDAGEVDITNKGFLDKSDYVVKGGVFHSFKHIETARKDVEWHLKYLKHQDYFIFKCIIPKGTEYYEGVNDVDEVCYGSKKIIIKEEI